MSIEDKYLIKEGFDADDLLIKVIDPLRTHGREFEISVQDTDGKTLNLIKDSLKKTGFKKYNVGEKYATIIKVVVANTRIIFKFKAWSNVSSAKRIVKDIVNSIGKINNVSLDKESSLNGAEGYEIPGINFKEEQKNLKCCWNCKHIRNDYGDTSCSNPKLLKLVEYSFAVEPTSVCKLFQRD